MKKLVLPLLLIIFSVALYAQDTLPKFSLRNVGNNRIIVGWTNTFETIRQISIQRSFDSLINYKSIMTVADPTTLQNGYVDTKASNDHMFYRLYILLDKGVFLFSDAKRPVKDTLRKAEKVELNSFGVPTIVPPAITDSITVSTPSTFTRPKSNAWVPSKFVFTYKDGYVRLSLPDDETKIYGVKFFEDDGTFLFELKNVKERSFKLDKTNFYHAGWFKFEIYENGELFEKNKFYLAKDF